MWQFDSYPQSPIDNKPNQSGEEMQPDTDDLDYLQRRLSDWDQDLRWGHRGVDQFTMFLEEATAKSRADGHGQGCEPDSSARYSRDDLEDALPQEIVAEFRILATRYLRQIPRLLVALEACEEILRADPR